MNKRSNGKMKYRMLSILGLVIFFGVWEAAVRLGWVSHRSLNAPSEVVETFKEDYHYEVFSGQCKIRRD